MKNDKNIEIKKIEITKPHGLHLRVAGELVRIFLKYKSKVLLSCNKLVNVEGDSIMNVLTLGAKKGDSITIKAEGKDAKELIEEVSNYFSNGSGI